MRWFALGTDLFLTGLGVWLLLIAHRVVGKPTGMDEKYDAWHRQWVGTWKLLGWGWIVVAGLGLVGVLLW
jgi:hypothetical protein